MLTDDALPADVLALGFTLPASYRRAVALGLTNLDPWRLLDREEALALRAGLARRYPTRRVLPFARRVDTDDVAAFDLEDAAAAEPRALVLHDFADPGWELDAAHDDGFWGWFRAAVEDVIAGGP